MQQQQERAPAAAADASHHHQRQQQQQRFDALHGELVAEARGTARECGVDVRAVVFRPDDDVATTPRAVCHHFLGMRRLLARDVTAMGPAELAEHVARLKALRAALVDKLHEKEKDEAGKVTGRAPGQQEKCPIDAARRC